MKRLKARSDQSWRVELEGKESTCKEQEEEEEEEEGGSL